MICQEVGWKLWQGLRIRAIESRGIAVEGVAIDGGLSRNERAIIAYGLTCPLLLAQMRNYRFAGRH